MESIKGYFKAIGWKGKAVIALGVAMAINILWSIFG